MGGATLANVGETTGRQFGTACRAAARCYSDTMVCVGRNWWWLLGVGLALGCGPSVTPSDTMADDGGDTVGDDDDDDDDDATASDSGGDDDDDDDDADSGDTGEVCAEILDAEPPVAPTLVEITNGTGSALFVGFEASCIAEVFSLTRISDEQGMAWHGQACTPSCEEVLAGECFDCGACPEAVVVRLEAGATHTVEWSGSIFDTRDFPTSCLDAPCSTTCDQRLELAAGEYRFDVVASTDCIGDGMSCDCHDGSASCEVYPFEWAPSTHTVSVDVALPTPTVAITIE